MQLPISGTTCDSCARHLATALTDAEGVVAAEVSYEASMAMIEYQPGALGKAVVRKAGFGVDSEDEFYSISTRAGRRWIPAYIQAIDYEKCTGCGACARTCGQSVYQIITEGDCRRVEIVQPEDCLGDCHCHKACKFGALICKPRRVAS